MKWVAHTPAPKTMAAPNNHGRGRSLSASLARMKNFMDVEQAAMQINAARKTSRRSCCPVRQLYTRSIVHPCSVRIVVSAPPAPVLGKCLDQGSGEPPASRHFSGVHPANVSHGCCFLLFGNAQVLSCWRVRTARRDQPQVNRFPCNCASANPRRLQPENPLNVMFKIAKPVLFEARKIAIR